MKKIKWLLPLLAVLIAAVAVWAGSNNNPDKNPKTDAKKTVDYVWIKYDCDPSNPQPEILPAGNTTTAPGGFNSCEGLDLYICSVRLPVDFTEQIPNTPAGNLRPLSTIDIDEYDKQFCE